MVSATSFATRAVESPTRFYKRPGEVVQDRRLSRDEKLAILEAWELEARELSVAADENMSGGEPSLLQDVVQARVDLGETTDPAKAGGAPTKHGMRKAPSQD
jgi:hypothetical protein